MYHKVTIIGNLGGDPELRYLAGGMAVCDFKVAANKKYKKDGESFTETVWFKCTAWGKLAETLNEYLNKGRLVYIEGTIKPNESGHPRTFELKDGTAAASYEITVNECKFLSKGTGGGDEEPTPGFSEKPQSDEIPF